LDFAADFWEKFSNFLAENIGKIFVIFLTATIFYFIFKKWKSHENRIFRIWQHLLFFLTKRQMLIPLIFVLAQKKNFLEQKKWDEIWEIRRECRQIGISDPKKRWQKEKKISAIFFEFFAKMEKSGEIPQKSKLEKVARDLEFIDQKLFQLQKIYNAEIEKWRELPRPKIFFRNFEKFAD